MKKLSQYKSMVGEGLLPVERGLILNEDDKLRQFVIEEIMCKGMLPYNGLHGPAVADLVRAEAEHLQLLADDGLIKLETDAMHVTQKGRIFSA